MALAAAMLQVGRLHCLFSECLAQSVRAKVVLSKSRKLKPDLTDSKGEDDAFEKNAEAEYLRRVKSAARNEKAKKHVGRVEGQTCCWG